MPINVSPTSGPARGIIFSTEELGIMQKFEYRSPRFSVDLPIRISLENSTLSGRCTEISKEGMRVELEQPLPSGVCGKVFLSYQDANFELNVRVAYAGATHSGLQFICELEQEREEVAELVESLASTQHHVARHL